jgi:hypothetical protein
VKLIQQVTLHLKQAGQLKIYEVDLCQVGHDRFVVNYRHGEIGSVYTEGAKTTMSVAEDEARRILERFINELRSKGYAEPENAADSIEDGVQKADNDDAPAREDKLSPTAKAILARVAQGISKQAKGSLSRAAWRCGELRLRSAEPYLLELLGKGDGMLDYSIVWSLAQVGSNASVSVLTSIEADKQNHDTLRRIAALALIELDAANRDSLIGECIQQLPESIRELAEHGPAADFTAALKSLLANTSGDADFLEILYWIDNEHVRPGLLCILKDVPFAFGKFRAIRHIFKAAELRRDADVFGLLSWRFSTTLGNFQSMPYSFYRIARKPEANTTHAFCTKTRNYLRRRVHRTVNRIGQAGHAEYVPMAAGVLASFSDSDACTPFKQYRYLFDPRTRKYSNTTVDFDEYANFITFSEILYGNSGRYRFDSVKQLFACVAPFQPGNTEPADREEAFPELWDQQPDVVVGLLVQSRCEPVHRFGIKVLRANQKYAAQIEIDVIRQLLGVPYQVTLEYAFEIAKERFDPAAPDAELVLALANCDYSAARAQAYGWIEQHKQGLLSKVEFVFGLIVSEQAETRRAARTSLREVNLSAERTELICARLTAHLLVLSTDEEQIAAEICETMLLVFSSQLKSIGEPIIRDLLASSVPTVQRFAGDLILQHSELSKQPPQDILQTLLDSEHVLVRSSAIQIIYQLPDEVLKSCLDLLIGLTRHVHADVRAEIRSTVVRLTSSDTVFGEEFASVLIEALLTPGAPEGVPTHTARVLIDDLRQCLSSVSTETVWRLLQSRSGPAQEVGGVLLGTNVDAADLSVDDIANLATHEVSSVRESAHQMCRDNVDRLRAEPEAAVRILDSRWEDTRQFAFEYFQQNFADEGSLSPSVLVSICDSLRPDVQQFGRSMITRLFEEGHGEEYVLKLSEHPTQAMQLFASNFLDQHASNNPDQFEKLSTYFVSVLSRVNRGRVAKSRVLQIIEREGLLSEQSAATALEILARVSATIAIMDRATIIESMLRIQTRFPNLPSPLKIRPLEVRGGV